MIQRIIFSLATVLLSLTLFAQESSPSPTNEKDAETKYKRNIKKSRINGVYIPKDYMEALKEIKEMSPPEALAKFRGAKVDQVIKKLHFGLGRWIRYNWNFYEGSRLSHSLKEMGVSHPDDMSTFLMTLLHRELNNLPMEETVLAEEIRIKRLSMRAKGREVLEETVTKKSKN